MDKSCTSSLQDPLKRKQLQYYPKMKTKNQIKHHKGNDNNNNNNNNNNLLFTLKYYKYKYNYK